ncbi:hypothetical protein [Micromonospora siamensis]|uniref:Uncharacterized protein n=1 Tax=Micromonospora siamensis TaxID=299152 RepID=A0A1C5GY30_9ACTN|nr:hypothetical protein [Micromonospora siamensis]SCG38729.1 hypothetical protein GA0074704_0720 [Micromonospora siamensis]
MTTTEDPPVRPPRPHVVTVAFWLQIALVTVLLLLVALVVWHAFYWNGEIDRALAAVPDADPAEVAGERSSNVVPSAVLGGLAVLVALGWGITAIGVRRGSNPARITTFVLGGALALLCIGPGCSGALLVPFFMIAGDPEGDYDEYDDPGADPGESKFLDTLYSSSTYGSDDLFFGLGGIGVLLVVGLTIAVVVLLLTPTANRWFNPRTASAPPAIGYPAPAAFVLPPGYMICPDPRAHVVPAGAPPVVPPTSDATPPTSDASPAATPDAGTEASPGADAPPPDGPGTP